jgi:D-alanyl-D-alanine carboxypeptidase (penicillin-binding protein 5/6)
MSCELLKHELIKKYSTVWMDTLREGESELVNTNKLVRFYEGTTGLKTGTTSQAKYCLSATAERNGMELVAVVMAGESSNDRFEGAKKMLDYGFANYSFSELSSELSKDLTVKVIKGVKENVRVSCDEKINMLMPKTSKEEVTRKTEWNDDITAPIKKGDVLGKVNVYVGETQVGTLKIVAVEDVKRLTLWVAFKWIVSGVFNL